jgi:hypothetical protein
MPEEKSVRQGGTPAAEASASGGPTSQGKSRGRQPCDDAASDAAREAPDAATEASDAETQGPQGMHEAREGGKEASGAVTQARRAASEAPFSRRWYPEARRGYRWHHQGCERPSNRGWVGNPPPQTWGFWGRNTIARFRGGDGTPRGRRHSAGAARFGGDGIPRGRRDSAGAARFGGDGIPRRRRDSAGATGFRGDGIPRRTQYFRAIPALKGRGSGGGLEPDTKAAPKERPRMCGIVVPRISGNVGHQSARPPPAGGLGYRFRSSARASPLQGGVGGNHGRGGRESRAGWAGITGGVGGNHGRGGRESRAGWPGITGGEAGRSRGPRRGAWSSENHLMGRRCASGVPSL